MEEDESGEEEPYYFHFSATLRIFGDIGDLDAISETLGVAPTHSHRRGDAVGCSSWRTFEHDMWAYSAPVPEDRPLDVHLNALWRVVQPNVAYLKGLKDRLSVDIFCGYRSNCATGGFEIDHGALVIFSELGVPLGISVLC